MTGTIKKYQDSLVASWLHPFSVYRSHEQMALRRSLAELRAMRRELHLIVAKANFDPGQPRVPSGQPGGGQWTRAGDGAAADTADGAYTGTFAQGDNRRDDAIDNGVFSGDQADDIIPAAERREFPRDNSVVLELEEGGPQGGHTIRDHVGKSDEYLIRELEKKTTRIPVPGAPGYTFVVRRAEGSFSDVRTANDLVNRALDSDQEKIDRVVTGLSQDEEIDHRVGKQTGKEAYYSVDEGRVKIRPTYSVRVRIVPDQRLDRGFRVFSAYPFNQRPQR